MTDDGYKTLTVPCNIRSELDSQHEYTIVSCEPNIPLPQYDDIQKLNEVLDEINSENPGMTAEYLNVLLKASCGMSLFDEEFIRRTEENDFMFEDISDVPHENGTEESAARYLVQELKVPFDARMSKESFSCLCKKELTDYVCWSDIWDQYENMGFKIIEDLESEDDNIYLIYWK